MAEVFTLGNVEYFEAIIRKQYESGEQYELNLNHGDFRRLMRAMSMVVNGHQLLEDEIDWVMDFVSSIGESLGVEGV